MVMVTFKAFPETLEALERIEAVLHALDPASVVNRSHAIRYVIHDFDSKLGK